MSTDQNALAQRIYQARAPDLGPSASGRAEAAPTDLTMANWLAETVPLARAGASLVNAAIRAREIGRIAGGARAEEDRGELDRNLADDAGEAHGSLNVRVNAPPGTEVKANGDGMFKGNVSLDRQMQLPTLQ
jgi:hypothetical protein